MTTPLHAAASRMLASGTGTSSVAGRICSCSQKSLGVRTLRRDRKALRGFGNGLDQRKYGHDRRWNLCANDDERRERAKEKQNAFMKGISTFQDDKEGPTWDDVTATVWKALEEMPDSNNEYLETLKPYPARLPTMDEVLSTLIPQDISNDFISTGYEGTPSDYIVSTLGSCLSIWVLEPVLLYMALVLTKSDLVSNPALFCWANLFGNLISWTIPVGEPRIANMLAVSLASVLKLVMRSLPYDLPEEPFDTDAALQALAATATILVTQLILTQALLGMSLSDSLQVSVGTFLGIVFGTLSLLCIAVSSALPK